MVLYFYVATLLLFCKNQGGLFECFTNLVSPCVRNILTYYNGFVTESVQQFKVITYMHSHLHTSYPNETTPNVLSKTVNIIVYKSKPKHH